MDEEEILQQVIEETIREAIHLRQRIKKPTREADHPLRALEETIRERNRLESTLIE